MGRGERRFAIMLDVIGSACIGFALDQENWPAFRAWIATTHAQHLNSNSIAAWILDLSFEDMSLLGHEAQREQEKRSMALAAADDD